MSKEKIFAKGMFGKKKTFPNGGSVSKIAIKIEEFIPFLQLWANQEGYVNLQVSSQRNDPDKLAISLDSYYHEAVSQDSTQQYQQQPAQQYNQGGTVNGHPPQEQVAAPPNFDSVDDELDDCPF